MMRLAARLLPASRRALVIAALVALIAPAGALAQGNDILPPTAASPTPPPAPTATPTPDPAASNTGTTTLYAIGGALLVAFVGIGVWIARDARRSLPAQARRRGSTAEPLTAEGTPRARSPQAKQRARAAAKRQRKARRNNRPR